MDGPLRLDVPNLLPLFRLSESTGPRIFVNVPTAEHIAVIDRTDLKITATRAVSGAKANYPVALDEANHRVFVGCRKPAKVLAFDITTGKEMIRRRRRYRRHVLR